MDENLENGNDENQENGNDQIDLNNVNDFDNPDEEEAILNFDMYKDDDVAQHNHSNILYTLLSELFQDPKGIYENLRNMEHDKVSGLVGVCVAVQNLKKSGAVLDPKPEMISLNQAHAEFGMVQRRVKQLVPFANDQLLTLATRSQVHIRYSKEKLTLNGVDLTNFMGVPLYTKDVLATLTHNRLVPIYDTRTDLGAFFFFIMKTYPQKKNHGIFEPIMNKNNLQATSFINVNNKWKAVTDVVSMFSKKGDGLLQTIAAGNGVENIKNKKLNPSFDGFSSIVKNSVAISESLATTIWKVIAEVKVGKVNNSSYYIHEIGQFKITDGLTEWRLIRGDKQDFSKHIEDWSGICFPGINIMTKQFRVFNVLFGNSQILLSDNDEERKRKEKKKYDVLVLGKGPVAYYDKLSIFKQKVDKTHTVDIDGKCSPDTTADVLKENFKIDVSEERVIYSDISFIEKDGYEKEFNNYLVLIDKIIEATPSSFAMKVVLTSYKHFSEIPGALYKKCIAKGYIVHVLPGGRVHNGEFYIIGEKVKNIKYVLSIVDSEKVLSSRMAVYYRVFYFTNLYRNTCLFMGIPQHPKFYHNVNTCVIKNHFTDKFDYELDIGYKEVLLNNINEVDGYLDLTVQEDIEF